MKMISRCEKDTFALAADVAKTLRAGDVILLHGELGAGKTTFTKGLAKALGIEETVTSPTFNYVKEYQGIERPIEVSIRSLGGDVREIEIDDKRIDG